MFCFFHSPYKDVNVLMNTQEFWYYRSKKETEKLNSKLKVPQRKKNPNNLFLLILSLFSLTLFFIFLIQLKCFHWAELWQDDRGHKTEMCRFQFILAKWSISSTASGNSHGHQMSGVTFCTSCGFWIDLNSKAHNLSQKGKALSVFKVDQSHL